MKEEIDIKKLVQQKQKVTTTIGVLSFIACLLTVVYNPEKLYAVTSTCLCCFCFMFGWTIGLVEIAQKVK